VDRLLASCGGTGRKRQVPRSLIPRLLLALVIVDALFSLIIDGTFFVMAGIPDESVPTAVGVLAALWVGKVIFWTSIVAVSVRPLARWYAGTKPPTDRESILAVATTAYRAPFTIALVWSAFWAGTYMLNVVVLYVACETSVPLSPRAVEASVFTSISVFIGGLVLIFPLVEWLLAPLVEAVSLSAQERGIAIPGRGMTFRTRLVAFALTLVMSPASFMSGIAYMNDAHAQQRDLSRRAELAAAETALGLNARPADGAVFTFDASGTVVGRDAERALAEHPALAAQFERATASATTGVVSHPREGVVAFRAAGERNIGVVIADVAGVSFASMLLITLYLIIALLWGPLSALAIANSTAVPVARVSEALARVGEGEVSSAAKVPVFHQDEVGLLAQNYNAMLDQLRQLVARAGEVSKGALDIEFDVRGDLGDAFRGQVMSLRDIVTHIARSASQLAGAASEMYAAAQEQEAAAQQQSVGVEEVSRTMESLLVAATHVTESTMGVLTRAERTRETTSRTVERITELSTHTSRIGEILDVIREIADRSDLLALNASLEGTRAGEAGRGFALVAGEMRKLAERVTASVTDIKKLVGDVRASVSATVIATEESSNLAEGTTESARQINLVTQQQRSGTEQAGQSMRDVASMITQSLAATQQVRSLAEDLKGQADNLTGLVAKFRLPTRRTEPS
jgi:methyl-accepting chemotaxis protein